MKTIQDLLTASRALLQDQMEPYRYPTADLIMGLNLGLTEAYRLRPDMFVRREVPFFTIADILNSHTLPQGYQSAFLYYMIGHVQLRDAEDTQDARAGVFINKFTTQLLGMA